MAEEFSDQLFVDYVVKAIVNHPDDVRTERIVDERGVLISLHTNPEDMGYVIGRSGQTARSIRTLLRIVGAKNDARVTLKIIEPEGSTHVRREDREAAAAKEESSETEEEEAVAADEDDIDTSTVDDLTI
ncbi:MAG TPA: KH domain-containing protein [Patescibacteria group bacterium]|nr:KH domain-containing protein [Patescibacteria group bacterium]